MSPTLLRILIERRSDHGTSRSPYPNQRPIVKARKERLMFLELDTRENDGYTVSLEWNRTTGSTQIVVNDIRTDSQLVFAVPAANAGDALRHPFRYAP
jgi:hypothetical protein